MRTFTVISLVFLGCFTVATPAGAQVTNACILVPATKLEAFDTNLSVVVLKATTELGTIAGNDGVLSVRCREVADTSTGRKEQGLAMELTRLNRAHDVMLIDYDEIAPLLNAIDYFNKFEVTTTPFNFLDAEYNTKGGFHIAALGARRTGAIQIAVRDLRNDWPPVFFSRQQLPQLMNLITQAKSTLDSLRSR